MKNSKRFSFFAALAIGFVIATGAVVVPAMSYANEHEGHDEHGDKHEDHGDKHEGDHGKGHDDHK